MSKVNNFFMKHKTLVFTLVIVILAGVGCTKADDKDIAPIKISVADLAKAYKENKGKADKDYKNKTVEIVGTFEYGATEFLQSYIILSSEKAVPNVQIVVKERSEIVKIVNFKKGDTVTAQGVVTGKLKSKNVVVTNCILK